MNIIREIQKNETALAALTTKLEMLEDVVYNHPDDMETIQAKTDGVAIMATDYIMTANFKQQDIEIFNRKITALETQFNRKIQDLKDIINRMNGYDVSRKHTEK